MAHESGEANRQRLKACVRTLLLRHRLRHGHRCNSETREFSRAA
jgi:hypothetical protein